MGVVAPTVHVLTFNLGACSGMSARLWRDAMTDASWAPVLNALVGAGGRKGALLVTTQEDSPRSPLLQALQATLQEMHGHTHDVHVKVHKSSMLVPRFCVGTLLALPKAAPAVAAPGGLPAWTWLSHDSLVVRPLGKKGSWIVHTPLYCCGSPVELTFVASHLPFEPSKPDLGNKRRLAAVGDVLQHLMGNPTNKKAPALLVWAGDLNFRTTTQGEDQLQEALNARVLKLPPGFGPLQAVRADHGPTCKVRPSELAYNRSVRCSKEYTEPKPVGSQVALTPECYDPKRVPSYCDRVLVSVRGKCSGQLGRARAHVLLLKGTERSDHNPVMTSIRLTAS